MTTLDLIGRVFGRLTVVSKAPSIVGGNTVKRFWGAWNCICECGNTKVVKTTHLTKGQVSSCGCLISQYGTALKPGQKFNRLTTVEYKDAHWRCLCDCGNYTTWISTDKIISGNTTSCGCYCTEQLSKRAHLMHEANREYTKPIASARRLWQNIYLYRDGYCMGFDEFYSITQHDCFYCGISPLQEFNSIEHSDGLFIYNGIDRIDSLLGHSKDNCVACCNACNVAKNDTSIQEFSLYVQSLQYNTVPKNYINELYSIDNTIIPIKKYWTPQIKIIFNSGYKDGNLNIGQFYHLSQLPCFYCANERSNSFNRYKGQTWGIDKKAFAEAAFLYNGLDRVDNNQPHTTDNVVPCCYQCNFAKGKRTFDDFQQWIIRIKAYEFWAKPEYLTLIGA